MLSLPVGIQMVKLCLLGHICIAVAPLHLTKLTSDVILGVDASHDGLSAALSVEQGGNVGLITFASRGLQAP